MAITRWQPFRDIERLDPFRRWERLDPFREIDSLQRQMNRLLDRFISGDGAERLEVAFIPPAQLEETEDAIHLQLEVPGLEAKDINIEVTADSVSISGERKCETKTEEKGMTRSEFSYGRFQRVITLPSLVQNEKVDAKYEHGILRLTLPKAESEKHKAVKINVG